VVLFGFFQYFGLYLYYTTKTKLVKESNKMSELVKNSRKYNTWQLMHSITGWSKDYCKKVVTGRRNCCTQGAKEILMAFEELEKHLLNTSKN